MLCVILLPLHALQQASKGSHVAAALQIVLAVLLTQTISISTTLTRLLNGEFPRYIVIGTFVGLTVFAVDRIARRLPLTLAACLSLVCVEIYFSPSPPIENNFVVELTRLATWAQLNTDRAAVFALPGVDPRSTALFRVLAKRSLFVDFVGGGHVNYSSGFADEWLKRWTWQNSRQSLGEFNHAGIDSIILPITSPLRSGVPLFGTDSYKVYANRPHRVNAGAEWRPLFANNLTKRSRAL